MSAPTHVPPVTGTDSLVPATGQSTATQPAAQTATPTATSAAKPAVTRADRFMLRLLRIRQVDPIDMEAVSGAHRAFRWAIVFSAVRCTISYVLIPILIPVLNVIGSFATPISIALCVLALVNGTLGVRRFWWTDHRGKWQYTWFMALVFAITIWTLVHEFVRMAS